MTLPARIAITGGTGSFGRAAVRTWLPRVERLVVFSRDELKQAQLAEEFGQHPALRCFLGDVRDLARCREAFYHVDAVIHAAALKRVDAVSYSPGEVVKTNVLGTANVIQAAIEAGVRQVVLLSSDKAVQATNIYGATKFLAESYAVQSNALGVPRGTRISVVRYGNVVASRGSVIQIWRQQLAAGQPLTITDPDMTRFWLTLGDAVALVEQCLTMMRGGEILVPILPAAQLGDLAEAIAGPDYPRIVTGLRVGGEKRHEQLLSEDEVPRTVHRINFWVTPAHHAWTDEPWPGAPYPEGLIYTSDRMVRLTVEALRECLERI